MKINFYKQGWDIHLYQPGEDLSLITDENRVGMDTEFKPLTEGYGPIETAVMSTAFPESGISHVVWYTDIPDYLEEVRKHNPQLIWRLYSGAVDLRAVDFYNNFLWDLFWGEQGLVQDMELRAALYEIAAGTFINTLGLKRRSKFYLKEDLEGKAKKDDPDSIQMSYHRDMTLTDLHIEYAGRDAIATVKLGDVLPKQPNETIKTQGAFSLHMMEERGYPVDKEALKKVRKEYVDQGWEHLVFLADWGVWPGKSSFLNAEEVKDPDLGMPGGVTELQKVMKSLETSYGLEFKRTQSKNKNTKQSDSDSDSEDSDSDFDQSGTVSMNKDDPYKPFRASGIEPHPIINNHKQFKFCEHMLGTYLSWDMIKSDGRVHPYYDPIKKNGRTGAKNPAIQTLPQEGGIREVYTAPPGYKILVIDIKQGELCTLAQSCYDRFGFSYMGDKINAGEDLHDLYARDFIIPALKMDPDDLTEAEFDYYRKYAKPCNFGFPGGFGIIAFIAWAWNSYGIEFSYDFAKKSKNAWKEMYPEMELHLQPVPDNEFWLQNIRKSLKEKTGSDTAFAIRDFNDARKFMKETLEWPDDDIDNLMFKSGRYIVKTYDGPNNDVCIRRNASYTEACNYQFSRPLADAMSNCMAEYEPVGIKPACFVHDEFHFFVENNRDMQRNISWIQDVTRESTQAMVPDVKISIESQLTSRWYKQAKPRWDDYGNLLEWTPRFKK